MAKVEAVIRRISSRSVVIVNAADLTEAACKAGYEKFKEMLPLLEKHKSELQFPEVLRFSEAPYVVPSEVSFSLDAVLRARGNLEDLQGLLAECVRAAVAQRFGPDAEVALKWDRKDPLFN